MLKNPDLQTPEFSDPEDNFCVSPGQMLTDRLASERDTMFAQLKTEMIEIEDQLQRTNTIDLDDLSDEFE